MYYLNVTFILDPTYKEQESRLLRLNKEIRFFFLFKKYNSGYLYHTHTHTGNECKKQRVSITAVEQRFGDTNN